MTRCAHCKRRIDKRLMTTHDGRRMCAKCKREKIEQTSQLDKQHGND